MSSVLIPRVAAFALRGVTVCVRSGVGNAMSRGVIFAAVRVLDSLIFLTASLTFTFYLTYAFISLCFLRTLRLFADFLSCFFYCFLISPIWKASLSVKLRSFPYTSSVVASCLCYKGFGVSSSFEYFLIIRSLIHSSANKQRTDLGLYPVDA